MTDLTEFDESEETVEAADDPVSDITLDDLGEDKEINTPPPDDPDDAEPGDEPEKDKSEEAEPEKKEAEPEQKQTDADADKKADAVQAAPKEEVEKTNKEILDYLGMDSTLKIKGKEYKLREFSKDDLRAFIQKGVRMTQIGNELSQREQTLAERERLAEANARRATELMAQVEQFKVSGASAVKADAEPPEELIPSDYDTEDVRAMKQAALATWKANKELSQRLQSIESGIQSQQTESESKKFLDELNSHRADFPLASVEEVIAVHSLRPDIPLGDLVRRSHSIYGSVEHVDDVFKHCPEVRKHFEDKAVANYLARQNKSRVISEKPSSQGARQVPAAKKAIHSIESAGLAAKQKWALLSQEAEGDND